MAPRTLRPATFAFALAFASGPLAHAETAAQKTAQKKACVDAATRGQIQRDDGKLGAAAEAFAVCAESTCPPAVRQSCTEWLADAEARRPSVVITLPASNADADAKLSVDGVAHPFGASISLDPGAHVARVELATEAPFEQSFILIESEKKTIVAERPTRPSIPSVPREERPVPLSVWLLGGVSVVGFAGFTVFGLMAKSETDRLKSDCAPACSTDLRDDAFRTAIVADVALGVAVVAAVGATVLYLLRPTEMHATR